MVKRKKQLTEKDVDKLRVIDAYDHADKERTNNPPIGIAKFDRTKEATKTYTFDPNLDPTLEWAGKKEGMSFDVPTSSIHIHESIKPSKILSHVQVIGDEELPPVMSLFEDDDPVVRQKKRREALEFYKHGVNWTNRLIAGDSLIIMNSLLEKEGLAGQVQMFYFDPPYGIKYGSNFQPFINKRDVKDKKDEDLSQEPEMITAFRDTWELGIHSYLTYLRDRLLLMRNLLADSGAVFIQISDENVHHVREICDEIFGMENFVSQISFRKKTMPLGANFIEQMHDFIIMYAKNKQRLKFKQLYKNYRPEGGQDWKWVELPNGTRRAMTKNEQHDFSILPKGARPYRLKNPSPIGENEKNKYPFYFNGKTYQPPQNGWGMDLEKLNRLKEHGRIQVKGNLPNYVLFLDDFPVTKLTNPWNDTVGPQGKRYVVQTDTIPIQRCMLMTTDPDDLVMDITCGSGTTAYVAEQWGRRWITCDTSRVALELAKERLMTATFEMVDETVWPGVTVLKVQMNTDLMTEDLKKKRSSNQSFWLVGQPDVELVKDGRSKDKYKVIVHGFDYYDVKKGIVTSGTDSNIAMWMLDTNYDPMNCIEPSQVFFPMEGKKGGWNKLAKTLKAEINPDLIQKYAGNESIWFTAEPNTLVAVKIIDDRGIESLRVMKVGEE